MTRFTIISYPRTGSTYLVKVLNNCSSLTCFSELFHSDKDAFKRSFLDNELTVSRNIFDNFKSISKIEKLFDLRNKNPFKFLSMVFSSGSTAVGFKIFPGQNDVVLDKLLGDKTINKIILIRENLIRSFVSEQVALKTGKRDRFSQDEKPVLNKIMFDVDLFNKYAEKIQLQFSNYENYLRSTNQEYLKLSYEEITDVFPVKKISRYLGLDLNDIVLSVKQEKQNPFPLIDMLINYTEVKAKLENSKWQKYLVD